MQFKQPSALCLAWYRWKALDLPWRKSKFVGYDFNGNTFWIFRDSGGYVSTNTWRRIVKSHHITHLSEVKVSPLWHQWLRHVRKDPPTVQEQMADIKRQENIKKLAQLADQRWAAKPKVYDMTEQERKVVEGTRKILESVRAGKPTPEVFKELSEQVESRQIQAFKGPRKQDVIEDTGKELRRAKETLSKTNDNPWAGSKNPGENWQPKAWTLSSMKQR